MAGRHVALLRGINVGGNKRVDMAGLRALVEELGYADVSTLLNSGNVVFTAAGAPEAGAIETAIRDRYGFDVGVVLRSAAELRALVERNPFEKEADSGSRYMVTFLDRDIPAKALSGLDPASYAPELLYADKREIYAWLPSGIIDSKVMKLLAAAKLPGTATTRNWNTVTKLSALTAPQNSAK